MAERTRKNEIKVFISDDEKFILDENWKLSELRSRSDFIRQLIIYGYVFDVNYDGLKEYNGILTIQKRKGRRKIAGSGSWNRYELLILGYSSGSFPMSRIISCLSALGYSSSTRFMSLCQDSDGFSS